jgi:hypothetical protein
VNYVSVCSPDLDQLLKETGIRNPTWGHAVLLGWIFYAFTGDIEVALESLRHAHWLLEHNEEEGGETVSLWIRNLIAVLCRKHTKEGKDEHKDR